MDAPPGPPSLVNFLFPTSIGGNHAVVTQLGECKTEDLEVAGSSPAHGTMISPTYSRRASLWNPTRCSSTSALVT